MKKFFTLICALLLCQCVVVAQNYLHISSGDSTKMVRIAELDSVTVRDAGYYDPQYLCDGTYSDIFFEIEQSVAVYFWGNQYIAKEALIGKDLVIDCDPVTGQCVVKEQSSGYSHPTYGIIRVYGEGYYDSSARMFSLTLNYIVDAGTFGDYPATLQLGAATRAAALSRETAVQPIQPKQLKQPYSTLRRDANPVVKEEQSGVMLLKPVGTREIEQ